MCFLQITDSEFASFLEDLLQEPWRSICVVELLSKAESRGVQHHAMKYFEFSWDHAEDEIVTKFDIESLLKKSSEHCSA